MSPRRTPWLAAIFAVAAVVFCVGQARAHEFRPVVLTIEAVDNGAFYLSWRNRPDGVDVQFPDHCSNSPGRLDCGTRGIDGPITLVGLPVDAVVHVRLPNGETRTQVLSTDEPSFDLSRPPPAPPWSEFLGIGAMHVLGGFDHVLFVLGLLLLQTDRRGLLWTVTAFTAAHSITLVASVLGWFSLPQAPVEAVIALSIVLVARESLLERDTLTRRRPQIVAFLFGLIHGLGFAGALRETGFPSESVGASLAAFNVGIEVGQLAIVGVGLAVLAAVARVGPTWERRVRRATAYGTGGIALLWTAERVLAFWR